MSIRNIFVLTVLLFSLSAALPVAAQFRTFPKGTPGTGQKQVLTFGRVDALSDGNGVLLKWKTAYESGNLGFHVFRLSGGVWKRVNRGLIPGGYLRIDPEATYGREYSFFDARGDFGTPYYIQASALAGTGTRSQLIYPRFETNFVSAAGNSSAEMQYFSGRSEPVSVKKAPLISSDLRREVENANLPPDIVTQHWVAAQPGVKIGVKADGLYHVTKSELAAGGFDVGTDPDLWQLYVNGVQQSIIVEPNGDYIEFYGRSISTPHSDTNIYFLVAGSAPGRRIAAAFRRRVGGSVQATHYPYSFYRRDRASYIASIRNGSKENFFGAIVTTAGATVQFDLDGIDVTSGKANLLIGIQGFTSVSHRVSINVNGDLAQIVDLVGQEFVLADVGVNASQLIEGTNTIVLTSLASPVDLTLVESIRVNYARKYEVQGDQLGFTTPNMRQAVIRGFSDPNIRVFDMSFGDSPRLVSTVSIDAETKLGTSYAATIPANRAALMYAVADSAIKTVDSIAANAPSNLSDTANSADLLIVSYKDWMTEAGDWADYRRTDGFDPEVVDVEDLYDEFSYGIKSSSAIKDFIVYARANWQTTPEYALMVGDASYDPKNYTGAGFFDFVPTELVDTAYEETGSDEALADSDLDGLSDLAIGRIPARSAVDVTDALAKVAAFEQTISGATSRGFLCASDVADVGVFDFEALCSRIQGEVSGFLPLSSVNRGEANSKSTLLAAINTGKYAVNYAGHGSTNTWATTDFFGNGDVSGLTNQNDLSIFTVLTCLNGYFVEPSRDSLSEVLFKATNGGAVATWASAGRTTPDVQEVLARRFYSQLGAGTIIRLGDLVKDAKANVAGGRDVRLSWVLLGDPALKVH